MEVSESAVCLGRLSRCIIGVWPSFEVAVLLRTPLGPGFGGNRACFVADSRVNSISTLSLARVVGGLAKKARAS